MKKAGYWILFVICAASVGAYMARDPWVDYQEEKRLSEKAVEQMEMAEDERADLVKQRAKYRGPAGKEQLLRENGYVREGEVPLNKGL